MRISTSVDGIGVLVKARQPRRFWLPFFATSSALLPGTALLVKTTRPRIRTHSVEP